MDEEPSALVASVTRHIMKVYGNPDMGSVEHKEIIQSISQAFKPTISLATAELAILFAIREHAIYRPGSEGTLYNAFKVKVKHPMIPEIAIQNQNELF
jgi:hypothetical protein